MSADKAHMGIECPEEGCERAFLTEIALLEHAEAVHTFEDIRRLVSEQVREEYWKPADGNGDRTWVWVADIAEDWVVFERESGNDTDLLKCSYSILDNKVTLGQASKVRRRTVYEPIQDGEDD